MGKTRALVARDAPGRERCQRIERADRKDEYYVHVDLNLRCFQGNPKNACCMADDTELYGKEAHRPAPGEPAANPRASNARLRWPAVSHNAPYGNGASRY